MASDAEPSCHQYVGSPEHSRPIGNPLRERPCRGHRAQPQIYSANVRATIGADQDHSKHPRGGSTDNVTHKIIGLDSKWFILWINDVRNRRPENGSIRICPKLTSHQRQEAHCSPGGWRGLGRHRPALHRQPQHDQRGYRGSLFLQATGFCMTAAGALEFDLPTTRPVGK